MIKNKSILEEIERQKQEVSCKNCKHCNLSAYNGGRYYCKKRSVFDNVGEIEECYESRWKNEQRT